MELTSRQQEVLTELLNGYQSTESPMTGEDLADAVDLHPGTVRNQMQGLKALNLVEGIPGPKGGYKPTVDAYEALDQHSLDDIESLVLAHGYDRIDIVVDEIDFVDVNHPEECRARITYRQSIDHLDVGDSIVVGPTPKTRLVLGGEVVSLDTSADELLLDVIRLEAPVDE